MRQWRRRRGGGRGRRNSRQGGFCATTAQRWGSFERPRGLDTLRTDADIDGNETKVEL